MAYKYVLDFNYRLLKRKREFMQLTQTEVARRAGMTKMYYGKLEKGQRKPSFLVMVDLLRVFDIRDPSDLFCRKRTPIKKGESESGVQSSLPNK